MKTTTEFTCIYGHRAVFPSFGHFEIFKTWYLCHFWFPSKKHFFWPEKWERNSKNIFWNERWKMKMKTLNRECKFKKHFFDPKNENAIHGKQKHFLERAMKMKTLNVQLIIKESGQIVSRGLCLSGSWYNDHSQHLQHPEPSGSFSQDFNRPIQAMMNPVVFWDNRDEWTYAVNGLACSAHSVGTNNAASPARVLT